MDIWVYIAIFVSEFAPNPNQIGVMYVLTAGRCLKPPSPPSPTCILSIMKSIAAITLLLQSTKSVSAFLVPFGGDRIAVVPTTTKTKLNIATSSSSSFSKEDLETTFFSIDVKATGSIPRSSFMDALADLGVELSESQANELFNKYDADGGNSIDLEEFKALMSDPKMGGVKPNR